MLQQVTLKGLRIPHSAFQIPESFTSTNPTKTWRTVNNRNKLTFTGFSPLKEMKATLFCSRGFYKNIYNLAKVK